MNQTKALGSYKEVSLDIDFQKLTSAEDFQLEKMAAGYLHSFMIGKGNKVNMKVFSCGSN